MSDHTCEYCQMKYRTPGTIEVPASEVEALRDRNAAFCDFSGDPSSAACNALALRLSDQADKIIARLPPPTPDHVTRLRDIVDTWRISLGLPQFQEGDSKRRELDIAALEAAIKALEAKR